MIQLSTTRPEHFAQLAVHQRLCFPSVPPEDWMNEADFAAHLQVFPEGQHVALDGARVVAQSSTLRLSAARAFAPHTYREITGANRFTTHDPAGEWLYGADMSVHPDYRGRRISSMLYDTRKALVRRLGLRGIVAGGALPGYHHYASQLSVEAYVAEVVAGRLFDPTLTTQLRNGFAVRGILRGYLGGGELVEDATLLVWEA
ncbi:MAG: GNAT family N-acetyltransferase [Chloroflexi bacterium]|nr:GNAT family N-acetyltransferase [Chloroflexota bacterium]